MDPLQYAHRLAQSGDLDGAKRQLRAVLAREPKHPYALFLLGSIEAQQGNLHRAEVHLADAVKVNPQSPDALMAHGKVLADLKRHRDAIDAFGRALAVRRENPFALIGRGQSLAESGLPEEALRDFTAALRLDPRSPVALQNRAHVLIGMKRHREARSDVDALLQLAPDFLPARFSRIAILIAEKDFSGALSEIARALPADPGNPELLNYQAYALMQMKRSAEAIASFEKALAGDPNIMSAYLNLANLLMEERRLEDALSWCEKAVAIDSKFAPAHLLAGNIRLHLGHLTQSLKSYDAAIAVSPDYAEAHYHRGSTLLLMGRFKEGLADFEYRWRAADCGFDRPKLDAREWRGEPLAGKSIVVYSEQGLGDAIQFVRFLPMLAHLGAKITFLCHPNLIRLFETYAEDMEIAGETAPDRRFDFQCALMSLPLWLGTELSNLPNPARYLVPEAARVAHWREKIGTAGFKIGIGWQGNPRGEIDKGRSVPLASFVPLSTIPGVRLISLQKIHGLEQLANLPLGMTVETLDDFDTAQEAFIDTAAILQSLDLVVTSDTALPHLAGALGVPTWVALKHVPDWRWMLDRSDSPWYPSLTLFRQSAPGAWQGVFSRMAGEVRRLARNKANP
jgi:tetratricopeptide (TPR) repeat protein